ncbi:unnamed protein product, partial [Prorocentrum cordatum]
ERAIGGRANAAAMSLTASTTGWHDRLRDAAWGSAEEWAMSRELPRRISDRAPQCHREARNLKMRASDAESAFERLASRVKTGPRAAIVVSIGDEGAPERGEVMLVASGEASLPPAGAEPCDIEPASPMAGHCCDRFREKMAPPPSQVEEADIENARACADPSLRRKSARLDFAARLWESGMLGFTSVCTSEVAVFFAMGEARDDGGFALRPARDL